MAQTVRVGDTEDVVFTLKRNDVIFNLATITSATLRWRTDHGNIGLTDLTGLLTVLDAAAGKIKLKPDSAFWARVGYLDCYIDIILNGELYTFDEDEDKNPYRFNVVAKYS